MKATPSGVNLFKLDLLPEDILALFAFKISIVNKINANIITIIIEGCGAACLVFGLVLEIDPNSSALLIRGRSATFVGAFAWLCRSSSLAWCCSFLSGQTILIGFVLACIVAWVGVRNRKIHVPLAVRYQLWCHRDGVLAFGVKAFLKPLPGVSRQCKPALIAVRADSLVGQELDLNILFYCGPFFCGH